MPITLIYNNEKFELLQSQDTSEKSTLSLAQAIFWSGQVPARPLCAGIASCGRCKVRFISPPPALTATEEKLLTQKEKDDNIRLSCRHTAQDDMIIELLTDYTSHTRKAQTLQNIQEKPANLENLTSIQEKNILPYRLFVDIGTTSIAWQCEAILTAQHHTKDNNTMYDVQALPTFSGGALNPQMIAGADVMARLHSASTLLKKTGKPHLLQELIQTYLQNLIQEITHTHELKIEITEIFVAANSAIMALSLGTDFSSLCSAPYVLKDFGNRYAYFDNLPTMWIAPQMSAFIGADACSGLAYILSLLANEYEEKHNATQELKIANNSEQVDLKNIYADTIFLLADMGTNGEFILFDGTEEKPKITATSVPLGPAIEGVGMRFGAPVHVDVQNIILSFHLGMRGLEYRCSGTPKHICGAAYLSLIHILLSLNILNRQGFFQATNPSDRTHGNTSTYAMQTQSPLAKKILQNMREENGEIRLYITDTLYICSEDIENILKVKSAFATAISLLTKEALKGKNLQKLYLSGSLADYIPLAHLENLGFIPQGAPKYTQILGNSSLKGLIDLAHSNALKEELIQLVASAKTLDLTANPIFAEEFIENMHF